MSAPDDLVQFSVTDHIATVALNRPDVLNAVSTPMYRRLADLFGEISESAAIWCVVVRGNGRAFCAGADRNERSEMTDDDLRRRRRITPRVFETMYHCAHPVVAQVHGHALGGGLEIALSCDIVVAAEGTMMGLVETTRGTMPAGGGTQLLPRLIGPARAKELIFTGRRFTAEQAADWGLVNRVVPEDRLEATVAELADEIVSAAPIANRQAKRAINMSAGFDARSGVEFEAELYERLVTTSDRLEGLAAAREGRRPEFKGE